MALCSDFVVSNCASMIAPAEPRAARNVSRSVNLSIEAHGNSQAMHRTGWILSAIVIAFMAADAGTNLLAIAPIKKAALKTGYPLDQTWLIGLLALIWLVLHAIPTTSVRGAIILTGFLGGAITSHLRVAGTLTPEMIVSLILGVTAWGGLWFRDPRIRALISRRHNGAQHRAGGCESFSQPCDIVRVDGA